MCLVDVIKESFQCGGTDSEFCSRLRDGDGLGEIPCQDVFGGMGNFDLLLHKTDALMKRIHGNYRCIMGFNGALIGLGAMGILMPATASLLHNLSTIGIGLHSMTPLIREEE